MSKNVLNLNSVDAKKFFLTQEAYSNIELPPYFTFKKILSDIDREFKKVTLDANDQKKAKKYETINHIMYGNKDGKYAWRKYEIINPLIYVSLVNILTEKTNWSFLLNRFKEFRKNKSIECESMPVLPGYKSKQKATQISQWVSGIEKKSMVLSLDYKFLFQTDITDCYGSIYTHSIPWAIHTKEISKQQRGDTLFGNKVDFHFQAMSFGQTNGIPQGSILMDFIAEIVLGYADEELSKKLELLLKDKKYHILRYRDDYRIFVNDTTDGDIILKCLSEILIDLGFRLNTNKTFFSNDVISGSIKDDKLNILNTELVPKKLSKTELLRQLLIVQQIGIQFPNSGTLKTRLSKVLSVVALKDFYGQQEVIAGLLTDIAYNSPNSFPVIAGLISKCILKLPKLKQKNILIRVQRKICTLSNVGLLEVWTQRISLGLKFKLELKEKLCSNVYGVNHKIFETDWIDIPKIKKMIDENKYIDKAKINKMKPLIQDNEVQVFNQY